MVNFRIKTKLLFAIVFPDLVKRFTICVFSQWGKSDSLVIIMQILAAFRVVSPFVPSSLITAYEQTLPCAKIWKPVPELHL